MGWQRKPGEGKRRGGEKEGRGREGINLPHSRRETLAALQLAQLVIAPIKIADKHW